MKRKSFVILMTVVLCVSLFGTVLIAGTEKEKEGLTIAYVRPGNVEYYKYGMKEHFHHATQTLMVSLNH